MKIKQKTTIEIMLDEADWYEMVYMYLGKKSTSSEYSKGDQRQLEAASVAEDLEARAMRGTSSIKPECIRIRFVPERR